MLLSDKYSAVVFQQLMYNTPVTEVSQATVYFRQATRVIFRGDRLGDFRVKLAFKLKCIRKCSR